MLTKVGQVRTTLTLVGVRSIAVVVTLVAATLTSNVEKAQFIDPKKVIFLFQMVSATPYNLLTSFSRIPEENIVDCVGNDDVRNTGHKSYYGILVL